ncbi:unnamed protein product [Rotaria magnacalcarata]|uniref:Uncharacterized protein n=2 Tax=Rotaria magnacalcarata TaxID=392030 RepID=A0A816AM71_9BILA|nr:unnamed protein product [Rotaria magnacalcarata]CAF1599397.1 unnamed protein product [Rotaria magnacalcarata]CAF1922727.1 unnamed protein product [Rotaria magnacalcarata]CAF4495743.1 unnamed protein product [Rotaria magnacalcarata]CAF4535110.1 unnamed protein product [Rotaria magnacalcarata]
MTDIEATRGQPSRTDAEGKMPLDLIPKSLMVVLGSTYCLLVLCVLLVIPILQLAIGASYRDQCTINSNIPVYLIVTGACGMATIILTLVLVAGFIFVIKRQSVAGTFVMGCITVFIMMFISLMSFFLFIWFIVGNVWIFGAKKNVQYDNPAASNYCHRTLYQFAFAILIISYVMCCISCCSRVVGSIVRKK